MRWLLVLLLLVGCGKRTDPTEARAEQPEATARTPSNCMDVVILRVDKKDDAPTTFMEDAAPAPGQLPQRYARSGEWGNPGDKFRYCEGKP